jgi:hypothetical protein
VELLSCECSFDLGIFSPLFCLAGIAHLPGATPAEHLFTIVPACQLVTRQHLEFFLIQARRQILKILYILVPAPAVEQHYSYILIAIPGEICHRK